MRTPECQLCCHIQTLIDAGNLIDKAG